MLTRGSSRSGEPHVLLQRGLNHMTRNCAETGQLQNVLSRMSSRNGRKIHSVFGGLFRRSLTWKRTSEISPSTRPSHCSHHVKYHSEAWTLLHHWVITKTLVTPTKCIHLNLSTQHRFAVDWIRLPSSGHMLLVLKS